MRRVVEQALSLGQVLVDKPEFTLLQVAEAAVNHLRGFGGRTGREVVLFDESGPQAATGGIEGDAGAGDTASDDQHVELLVGEASQRIGAAKGCTGQACHILRASKPGAQLPSG